MSAIFIDTSALLRRYDRLEPGARRVRAVCAPAAGHSIFVAHLVSIEIASALNRKVRLRQLRPALVNRLWQAFRDHREQQYHVVALDGRTFSAAEQLVFRHPLKALDALQVASALGVAHASADPTFAFWTADRQQAAAARAEGLTVELVA